jgi:phosphopantothenoylcysteine decarboxylase/phosphopantothenate--cysteine ligase
MIPPYLQFSRFQGSRIHLGVTGSIAAYKVLDLCRDFLRSGIEMSATMTRAAQEFLRPLSFEGLGVDPVYTALFDHEHRLFGHLEPGQVAHTLVIAPATANSLAKLAHGLADDMLSCQALAFSGPLVVCPAMNPRLWNAPATQENIDKLVSRNVAFVAPGFGEMACGDTGQGKLASIEEIYLHVLRTLSTKDLAGKRLVITLGPTREFWDPVRFWSNPSSGKMAAALAIAAWLRGAQVDCVCGPNQLWFPEDIRVHPVTSAQEMYETTVSLWPDMDIGCLCAAVCDFRPETVSKEKFKKDTLGHKSLQVNFVANPDILKHLGQEKTVDQRLIGFAAESTASLFEAAQSKIRSKNLDIIVANNIADPEYGFGSPVNQCLILDRFGAYENIPQRTKADIAWRIWDWILQI